MPFNGSGVFSILNVFVPNTTILSSAVNANYTDIATGLSDCLTRDGQAGMTAAFKAISGTLATPGISFTSDATAGLYLSSSGVIGLVAKSLGILVNSSIYCATAAAVQAGGSGYAVGDTITLTGGTAITQAVLTVATLSGSAVATVTVTYSGFYSAKPTDPVAQGSTSGSGTGATFNMTWAAQFTRSIVTNEAGALPWTRLGASSYVSGIMAKANAYDYAKSIIAFGSGTLLSNATSPPTLTTTLNPTLIPNYISGLTLSTGGGSAIFGIAAGVANDSTNTTLMQLGSAYTKTTSNWAVGSTNGGLDTGAIANGTWYHVYQIQRPDTGVVDVIFSLSASAPSLPANYTLYRRIGSIKTTTGSPVWQKFVQVGDQFLWDVMVNDINTATLGTTATLFALTTPLGVQTTALLRGSMSNASASIYVIVNSPSESAQASAAASASISNPVAGVANSGSLSALTNTSSQVRAVSNASSTTVLMSTYGWIDTRGKG